MNFVSCDLLALPGAAYDNAEIGQPANDVARACGAIKRVVNRLGAICPEVFHVVAELLHMGHHSQLEHVAGVVVGDRDLHSSHF